jgi:DNA-3-methyladenine glycosylase I
VWSHAPAPRPTPLRHRDDIPSRTDESTALATALRGWGMRFVGPTTAYAFMQSAGLVDDHLASCHRAHAPSP